jgi:hypothetical protein
MNPEIKKALVMLAAYYEKVLSPEQIEIYSNQLAESLSAEETLQACKMYIAEPANEFFPRPLSKLIHLIKKPVSNEDQSSQISALLIKAVQDFGSRWTNGTFGQYHYQHGTDWGKAFEGRLEGKKHFYEQWDHAAISVFGQIGLTVVNRYGGWERFCENVDSSHDGVIRAQVKNLATSLLNTVEKTGSFEVPLSLSPSKDSVLIGNVIEMKIKELK